MRIEIRRAGDDDVLLLGWVMYTAAPSHLPECPWGVIYGQSEAGSRSLLERVSQTGRVHWRRVSRFWIAEADGSPAVPCGFAPATAGTATLVEAAPGAWRSEQAITLDPAVSAPKSELPDLVVAL